LFISFISKCSFSKTSSYTTQALSPRLKIKHQ
jgi:hypothetical protein